MLPQYYFHDYKNIFHISFSFCFVYFLLPRNTQWYKLEEMIIFNKMSDVHSENLLVSLSL